MALSQTRLIYRSIAPRCLLQSVVESRRHQTGKVKASKPYRPWPLEEYNYPESSKYWEDIIPSPTEADDKYPREEVYLEQIEDRMEKFDKKYRTSPEVLNLYNEYGWVNEDDRAYGNYPPPRQSPGERDAYGPGKKIDPAHYSNGDFENVHRVAVAPVELMTGAHVRRVRGRVAKYSEMPPEEPSIWKKWNFYPTLAGIFTIAASKEFFFPQGHDVKESVLLWCIIGTAMTVGSDLYAWSVALKTQETYDLRFLPMKAALQKCHDTLEKISKKPSGKQLTLEFQAYKADVSERVLQKTLSNRVFETLDGTVKKLEAKMAQERSVKAEAQSKWKRQATDETNAYFEESKVHETFSQNAITQFATGDAARLSQGQGSSQNLFEPKYMELLAKAEKEFYASHKKAGSLPWVFMTADQRSKAAKSAADKTNEVKTKVESWSRTHNPVLNVPTFA